MTVDLIRQTMGHLIECTLLSESGRPNELKFTTFVSMFVMARKRVGKREKKKLVYVVVNQQTVVRYYQGTGQSSPCTGCPAMA